MLVKICGIHCESDVEIVNKFCPYAVGFVFYKKSRRYVTYSQAKLLRHSLDEKIKTVGVFVNDSILSIAGLVENQTIDIVQLHGDETDEFISLLRTKLNEFNKNVPIIKAFKVRTISDIEKANTSSADMVLLDNGMGTGEQFNQELLGNVKRPFILAGGISKENVIQSIKKYHPFMVDVSSSLETNGQKDEKKIREFMNILYDTEERENE